MFGKKMCSSIRATISRLRGGSNRSSAVHSSRRQPQGDVFLINNSSNYNSPSKTICTISSAAAAAVDSDNNNNGFTHIKDRFLLRSALAERSKLGFNNPADSVTLFDRMVQIQPVPTIADFNEFFTILARLKLYSNAIYLIKRLRVLGIVPIDDFTLNVMLNCYCRLDRVHYGYAIIGSLFKHGYAPHEYAYTVLLNGLIGEGEIAESLELYNRLVRERRIDMSFKWTTHTTHMNALFKTGDFHKAEEMLDKIEQVAVGIDDSLRLVFNTIINGFCKCGQVDLMRDYYYGMVKLLQISPNVSTLNSLIQGYASLGQWDDVRNIMFRDMIDSNNLPDEYTFYLLVEAFGNNRLGEVRELLLAVQVEAMHAPCGYSTFGSAIVNMRYNDGDKAETILKIMSDAKADLVAYNSVMKRYCLDGRVDKSLQVFKSLATRGFHANISSYNILIDAYCNRAAKLDEAMQLYREIIPMQGLRPNRETFSSLLKGMLIAGRYCDAEGILHDMVSRGKAPDMYTYTSLVHSFVEGGRGRAGKLGEESSALWYKWLKPDFCHEEIVNQAEKLLLDELEVIS